METILAKYLSEECTAQERAQVEQWIKEDEQHQKIFEELQAIWNESEHGMPQLNTHTDEAWQRFRSEVILKNGTTTAPIHSQKLPTQKINLRSNLMRAAAGLLLLIGLTFLGRNYYYGSATIHANTEVVYITLSDGSVVTLNKGASLIYPRHFSGKQRLVALKGEGFFKVHPDKVHPFIVQSGQTEIKVLGTSFNINNRADHLEVIVETGLVKVSTNKASEQITANESVVVDKSGQMEIKKMVDNKLYNYYRSNLFICDNTPLRLLIKTLEEAYQVKIEVAQPNMLDMPITTTFQNNGIDNILEVVAATYGMKVQKNGTSFRLN